ncbi:MAG: hypothetical protein V1659_04820 [Candidatus Woesearchaeota archaeon]
MIGNGPARIPTSEEARDVTDYLLVHRDRAVSIKEIRRAVGLTAAQICYCLDNLSDECVLKYMIDETNWRAQELLAEYEERQQAQRRLGQPEAHEQ